MNFFDLLEKYDEIAPKSIKDIDRFEKSCRSHGYTIAADWLHEWKLRMERNIKAEFEESVSDKPKL